VLWSFLDVVRINIYLLHICKLTFFAWGT